MSLIRNDDVLWYHPLDSDTEYTKSYDWVKSAQGTFDTGVIVSGFTQSDSTSASITGDKSGGGYDDLEDYDHFTVAFWSNGLYGGTVRDDSVYLGFSINDTNLRNGVRFRTIESNGLEYVILNKRGVSGPTTLIPLVPSTEGWHLTVIDFSLQGSVWQHLVSIDGSGWQNIGSGHNSDLPDADNKCLINMNLESVAAGSKAIIDEVVIWVGHDTFTEDELSNLYELVNTYDSPMNSYSSTFGTPINSGINCFIHGSTQISGDISLYIPSQKETNSITLYTITPSPTTSNVDSFIYGHQVSSGSVDNYTIGYSLASGSTDLYISGVPVISSSITLHTVGPLPSSGSVNDFIWGHLPSSGDYPLFIKGLFPIFDAFVSTVENNPSNNVDLFTHGVPSGVSDVFYINDLITLFIEDSGDIPTVNVSWSSFTRVDDAIATGESCTWSVFVKGGNADNNNISMYTYGHASGEAPHGTLVTSSGDLFIDGLSLQDGDDGLLSDGYSIASEETAAFTKVHLGLDNSTNMYISGSIVTVPPSALMDLFTFGILDTKSDSFTAYTLGLASASGQVNLFLFGIQDTESGSVPLYIEVTSIGSLDRTKNLYTHGF